MDARQSGFVQVDVDGLWAVRQCYGRAESGTFEEDPCWSEGVPALADSFSRAGLPASFFIVGRDLELPHKRAAARRLHDGGFELANHSYTHTLGLTAKPSGFILDELERTDAALRGLGAAPTGFRAPGYDVDVRVLRCVRRLGYSYDASLLPTHLGPLLRLADAWLGGRWDPGKRQFGRFVHGRAPRRPFFPKRHKLRKRAAAGEARDLLEIPVGTTPTLRLPLTAATLLRMSSGDISNLFARLEEEQQPVLLLLHAIDGVDCRAPIVFDGKSPRLGGFAMSARRKLRVIDHVLAEFARRFRIERADHFAARLLESAR